MNKSLQSEISALSVLGVLGLSPNVDRFLFFAVRNMHSPRAYAGNVCQPGTVAVAEPQGLAVWCEFPF